MLVSISLYLSNKDELKDIENIKALHYIGKDFVDEIQKENNENKMEYHMEFVIGNEENEENFLDDINED